MKAILLAGFLSLLFYTACNNPDKQSTGKSDNDMDAVRNFLEASLKGNYNEAANYMLKDSTNLGFLEVTERKYKLSDADEKRKLREASLRFFDTQKINDSTTVTIFSNSYKNNKDTLKIIKMGDQWLVDLKYLFQHDMDSTIQKTIDHNHLTDSIHK